MKELYELKGEGHSIRGIARARHLQEHGPQVCTLVRGTQARVETEAWIEAGPIHRVHRREAFGGTGQLRGVAEGDQGVGILRQLSYSDELCEAHASPETAEGDGAVRDRAWRTGTGGHWGILSYTAENGRRRRMWAFVMVMGFSGAIYVELVRRADVATFIRCHLNAFEYFGGVPRRCLYDNAKVVVIERDEEGRHEWNSRMLDFARRVGFDLRLCRPYRAQTKGKVKSGVKYVRRNFWPSARFTDDADLNRQALEWCDVVANERVHGTTGEVPKRMLEMERSSLGALVVARRFRPR